MEKKDFGIIYAQVAPTGEEKSNLETYRLFVEEDKILLLLIPQKQKRLFAVILALLTLLTFSFLISDYNSWLAYAFSLAGCLFICVPLLRNRFMSEGRQKNLRQAGLTRVYNLEDVTEVVAPIKQRSTWTTATEIHFSKEVIKFQMSVARYETFREVLEQLVPGRFPPWQQGDGGMLKIF